MSMGDKRVASMRWRLLCYCSQYRPLERQLYEKRELPQTAKRETDIESLLVGNSITAVHTGLVS
jgi:hypothetical protein